MKTPKTAIYLAGLLLAMLTAGCFSENNRLLFDYADVEPLVNPATGALTTGDKIYGWMSGDSTIVGFGGGYAYYTPNLFDSIYAVANGVAYERIVYNDFENIIIYPEAYTDLQLEESNNFGETYTNKLYVSKFENRVENGTTITGTHSFDVVHFVNKDLGWVFTSYVAAQGASVFASGLKVYQVVKDAFNNQNLYSLLAELSPLYQPADAYFLNTFTGYLLVNDSAGNAYLLVSNDGGLTWPNVYPISNGVPLNKLEVVYATPNYLYAYSKTGKQIFYSSDSGQNWQSYNLLIANGGMSDLYAVDSQYAYAVSVAYTDDIASVADVYQTTNGGQSWQKVNQNRIYADAIDFYSQLKGVATSGNVLQLTTDGGKTWKVLVYPLE
ncbi:hypothetical protein C7N43_16505 [Sphingobacteriales bacterium UPWRP_1]|nr:hypothetical protein B6N25_02495 [Sphingobacteriales bacterium TSM_CSS]PSJ75931.1 hypothetical protein C7N43_16505 [Sphingobacteriales bacterium UPWRP_1]